jgi:O-acetyl-ADP-ribose deacetylase (regulator of RNase III)
MVLLMIELKKGNLLDSDAEALVNTVNAVGVMGKGIALQFKQGFPENFRAYEAACRRGLVQPGRMFVFHTNTLQNPRIIINFPTKRHWKGKSRMDDIESGLADLVEVIQREGIKSIAVPPLGCGNGGLKWSEVRPRIEKALENLPGVTVYLYQPVGAPKPADMKVATARPKMTAARAAILLLMSKYREPGYRLTFLEIQKLTYFLQMAGEPLKLSFVKQKYGPYAEQLHHVLQRLEGHFIRGYGDRSRDVSVTLLQGAADEAESFLCANHETEKRFERVARLIHGLETPYGMELLATVHWVAMSEDPSAREDPVKAVEGVQNWSEHKKRSFYPSHINIAWTRLKQEGWLV